ncbi:hypothetical protein, partial [Roseibium denhamense]|uniref:hypothetical protein n=1 Tax=Roseibium denhamense TaxID=76305 RepID=UPI0031DC7C80
MRWQGRAASAVTMARPFMGAGRWGGPGDLDLPVTVLRHLLRVTLWDQVTGARQSSDADVPAF